MKNLLTLHEAIVIALININKDTFTASFYEIAEYIEKRNLYPERKGNIDLTTQVMLRSTKSKGNYKYLFTQVDESHIKINSKT
jgi:predicted double-glycine peptidase